MTVCTIQYNYYAVRTDAVGEAADNRARAWRNVEDVREDARVGRRREALRRGEQSDDYARIRYLLRQKQNRKKTQEFDQPKFWIVREITVISRCPRSTLLMSNERRRYKRDQAEAACQPHSPDSIHQPPGGQDTHPPARDQAISDERE